MKSRNNWEVWHEIAWTEFELHSAIFGHLRKNLYPDFLVRGNYTFITKDDDQFRPDISIFKVVKGSPAKLLLVIEIKGESSTSSKKNDLLQVEKYKKLGVPVILTEGRKALQTILEDVKALVSEEYINSELK